MKVDTNSILSKEDKENRNSVKNFITNMYKLVEYTKDFQVDYEIADISRLKPFSVDDYTDYGSYNALTITPHSIFRNEVYSGETTVMNWEQVWEKIETSKNFIKENNLDKNMFRTHYVLANSNIRYAMGEDKHINFQPITKIDNSYQEMFEATKHLSIFQTRFVAEFYINKGLTLEEAIASVEMPKEWFIAMFSEMATNNNNSPF